MPVLSSGTFTVTAPALLSVSGDTVALDGSSNPIVSYPALADVGGWNAGVSGNLKTGGFAVGFIAGHSQLTCSALGVFFIESAPAGFTPTTNLRAGIVNAVAFVDAADTVTVDFNGFSSTRTGISSSAPAACVLTDGYPWALIETGMFQVNGTLIGQPFTAGSSFGGQGGGNAVTGNYSIVYVWWTIPVVDDCGNRHDEHFQLLPNPDDPGAPWERLDPLDLNAAPTPIILAVEPDHGPIAGGTAVTIRGSGFGDACSVEFDGVVATSIVTVDATTIACLAPAHVAGSAAVVVINEDGVTS